MGYTTSFEGSISINKQIEENHELFINKLAHSRRMKRNVNLIEEDEHSTHNIVGLGLGVDGEYYVDGEYDCFSNNSDNYTDIIEHNKPPKTQPGLWCNWIIDDNEIVWNCGEKFYDYIEWMKYIINILDKWGYICDGEIIWYGEDPTDIGKIIVANNKVAVQKAILTFIDENTEEG